MINAIQDTVAVVDTVRKSSGGGGWILQEVMDSHKIDFEPFGFLNLPHLSLFGFDISITKHIFFSWIVALILIVVLFFVARSYKKSLIPKGLTNFFEIIIIFVRDEIVKPTIGKGYEFFLPFHLTVFFFVLLAGLFGLVPYSSTVTGNIAVTAALAGISFIAIQLGGIKSNGFFGYFKGLIPSGMPKWLLVIIIPLEILGLFTKPFALCIRLFANMIAGHVVILSLIGLIFIFSAFAYAVAPISVGFSLFIYLLDILIILIQAYIFTMLTALFIGMAVHQEH
ncbi:MAG TPA: ATP synthase F0 subunit A [Ignavibacteria bacterium]|nr:ATP synthase F0 subunit A [Ignavibacteria bacterium]